MVRRVSRCRYCIHIDEHGWCKMMGIAKSGAELDAPGECYWYGPRECPPALREEQAIEA